MPLAATTSSAARIVHRATIQALLYAGTLLARDGLQLAPPCMSQAAARRFRRGLRVLEAFVRRLLLIIALELEPTLKPSDTVQARPRQGRNPPTPSTQNQSFSVFADERFAPDPYAPQDSQGQRPIDQPVRTVNGPVPSAPLLARFSRLRAILENPRRRALAVAWQLARRHQGPLLTPQGKPPPRSRTEFSALYTALGHTILERSRHRPPFLGLPPRPPPKIQVL